MTKASVPSTFEWDHFLCLADQLIKLDVPNVNMEALWRSAISRAYYAAFNIVKIHLNLKGYIFPSSTCHADVQKTSNKINPQISYDLHRLRQRRNQSDYDYVINNDLGPLAQSSIAIAKNIINNLQNLDNNNP